MSTITFTKYKNENNDKNKNNQEFQWMPLTELSHKAITTTHSNSVDVYFLPLNLHCSLPAPAQLEETSALLAWTLTFED